MAQANQDFFTPVTSEDLPAFAKVGVFGFGGSGKTFTTFKIALGLIEYANLNKHINFLDTEKSSTFCLDLCQEAGVELRRKSSVSFFDLIAAIENTDDKTVLIIDSLTAFWDLLVGYYQDKFEVRRLKMHHWGPIKEKWKQFVRAYINSPAHIFICGRGKTLYMTSPDDDGGYDVNEKGTGMQAEKNFTFEPFFCVEMEREAGNVAQRQPDIHLGFVRKDKFHQIDGQIFDNPDFNSFLPHFERINYGGKHIKIDYDNANDGAFDDHTQDGNASLRYRQKQAACEELWNLIANNLSSRKDDEKKLVYALTKAQFGATSKTTIEALDGAVIAEGLKVFEIWFDLYNNSTAEEKATMSADVSASLDVAAIERDRIENGTAPPPAQEQPQDEPDEPEPPAEETDNSEPMTDEQAALMHQRTKEILQPQKMPFTKKARQKMIDGIALEILGIDKLLPCHWTYELADEVICEIEELLTGVLAEIAEKGAKASQAKAKDDEEPPLPEDPPEGVQQGTQGTLA